MLPWVRRVDMRDWISLLPWSKKAVLMRHVKGATLTWAGYVCSHAQLIFEVQTANGRSGVLFFHLPKYFALSKTMHNVRLSNALTADLIAFRRILPEEPQERRWYPKTTKRSDLYVIRC